MMKEEDREAEEEEEGSFIISILCEKLSHGWSPLYTNGLSLLYTMFRDWSF